MIKNFINSEGHQNPISASKVTAILLKGWILPIGGASAGEGLRLQPAQQACFIGFYNFLSFMSAQVFIIAQNLQRKQARAKPKEDATPSTACC